MNKHRAKDDISLDKATQTFWRCRPSGVAEINPPL
jgi:hypothetical protein